MLACRPEAPDTTTATYDYREASGARQVIVSRRKCDKGAQDPILQGASFTSPEHVREPIRSLRRRLQRTCRTV